MVLLMEVWESLRMSRTASESSNRRHIFGAKPEPDKCVTSRIEVDSRMRSVTQLSTQARRVPSSPLAHLSATAGGWRLPAPMSRRVRRVSARSSASAVASASSSAKGPAPVAASASSHGPAPRAAARNSAARWREGPGSRRREHRLAECRQQPRGPAGDQHQHSARRWFLERLEQRVRGVRIQRIRWRKNRHLVSPSVRGEPEVGDQVAHGLDLDVSRVFDGRQHRDIGMLVGFDPPAALALAAGVISPSPDGAPRGVAQFTRCAIHRARSSPPAPGSS